MYHVKTERHYGQRTGWLRAAVLGANDGIVSTASLIVGVAAAEATRGNILIAGIAGLVAGAMSMAAGEYVSVSSQADTDKADLKRETKELQSQPEYELNELASIYEKRGLDAALAKEVAKQLTAHDALAAHARDELGHSETRDARPIQAALVSAVSFAVGGSLPVVVVLVVSLDRIIPVASGSALIFLAVLGGVAARIGGSSILKGIVRVSFWGAFAMGITAAVGTMFGVAG